MKAKANFNVRIVTMPNGTQALGHVSRLYKRGDGQVWDSVPESVRMKIAENFGLTLLPIKS